MTTTSPAPGDPRDAARRHLSERYLAYALSTIMARSLPDVRDGLKPVHRRLLFAMRQLRLGPDEPFKKSARSSATSWVSSIPMAMRQSMTRWSGRPGLRSALALGRWAGELRQYRWR